MHYVLKSSLLIIGWVADLESNRQDLPLVMYWIISTMYTYTYTILNIPKCVHRHAWVYTHSYHPPETYGGSPSSSKGQNKTNTLWSQSQEIRIIKDTSLIIFLQVFAVFMARFTTRTSVIHLQIPLLHPELGFCHCNWKYLTNTYLSFKLYKKQSSGPRSITE